VLWSVEIKHSKKSNVNIYYKVQNNNVNAYCSIVQKQYTKTFCMQNMIIVLLLYYKLIYNGFGSGQQEVGKH
jgi:hypothetical protein